MSIFIFPETVDGIEFELAVFDIADSPKKPTYIEISENDYIDYQKNIADGKLLKYNNGNVLVVEQPEQTEQEKFSKLVTQRDGMLTSTDWLIKRHEDQVSLNLETTLTASEFIEVQQWRQELRELPQKYPTSNVWIWPPPPDVITNIAPQN